MTRLKNILIIFIIAIVAISTVSMVSAADITISPTTSGGLKKAIDTAKNGDTIYLQNGVYKGKNNRDIAIKKDIKIIGKGNNVVLNGEGKYRFLIIEENKKVSVTKIKFTKGSTSAIKQTKGTLTVNSCTFTDNQATPMGGAINTASKCTVSKSTFTNNQAGLGGAIASKAKGSLTINSCTFKNNQATNRGGVINSQGDLTVSKSTFTNNQAKKSGSGAIYISGKKSDISGSTFTNNQAKRLGGAIEIDGVQKSVKITDSNFKNNKGDKDTVVVIWSASTNLITKNTNLIAVKNLNDKTMTNMVET